MIRTDKRQTNLLFPLLGLLLIAAIMLAGLGNLRAPDGRHNVYYTIIDGDTDGMHPCNDNGNNFFLTMFIEWSNGKLMLPGSQHCVGVISAEKVDELVAREMAKRGINPETASWDQTQEIVNFVLKEWTKGLIR